MTLQDQINKYRSELKNRATCFLETKTQILFGKKKEGIGEGKLISIGGKQEENELISETLKREVQEEIEVELLKYELFAEIEFYFESNPEWNQRIFYFRADKWNGTISETDEIKPMWVNKNDLPYDQLWDDHKFWLETTLENDLIIKAEFLYGEESQYVKEYRLEIKSRISK